METFDHIKAVADGDVLFTELQDGEAVLLHLETHAYYGLNQTGTRIWELIGQGVSLIEICQILCEQFDVTLDRARENVRDFMNELAAVKLVHLTRQ